LSALGLTPEQQAATAQQVQAYWSAPAWMTLAGAFERALATPLHITLSVLVLQAFTRRDLRPNPLTAAGAGGTWPLGRGWLFAAMGWHALANAVTVAVLTVAGPGTALGLVASEAALAALIAISLLILFRLRPRDEAPVDASGTAASEEPGDLRPAPSRTEAERRIDETRYSG
jgi:hypothetical protein